MRKATVLLLLVVLTTGCYRATVDTGLTPSGQTIEQPWAHSFVAGLVPPATVETAARCPDGVARVETQLSFLNMLANVVTFGIYSPMTITVQCAAQRTGSAEPEVRVPAAARIEEATHIFNGALIESRRTGEPVIVLFE
jgi:hypothetical protein